MPRGSPAPPGSGDRQGIAGRPPDIRLRRQWQVARICRTPRLVLELLNELDRYHALPDLDARLARYAELNLDLLRATGGDRLVSPPLHAVGRGR
jgi:hypothetical protein